MKKHLLLVLLSIFGALQYTRAQDQTVTGKVTSETDGTVLPGVNVLVKGSSSGTTTDANGGYSIAAPANATLVFSFIGFTTREEAVGNRSVINVTLATDVKQLSEVVVTAVGIERSQKALGYSVEKVEAGKLQQISEPDVLRGLQGKVPGVNIVGSSGVPGSATRLTIRGNRS
ncbi:MAG TPA: carboxypeptidase-like regulatory domain-containing protein, partial [Cytophagales bacterium]